MGKVDHPKPSDDHLKRSIPIGIEILVKKASIDPIFYKRLINARSAAAADIQLTLNQSEKAMLDTIPEPQLAAIIKNTKVPKEQRPAFLGCTASIMLLALAGVCIFAAIPTLGVRPDEIRRLRQEQPADSIKTDKPDLSKTNIEPNAPDGVE